MIGAGQPWAQDTDAARETWRRVVTDGRCAALHLDAECQAPASALWLWRVAVPGGPTVGEGEAATLAAAQRAAEDLADALRPSRVKRARAMREDLRGLRE